MVQNIIKIITAVGAFLKNLKSAYLSWVRRRRENKQTQLEKDIKQEVEQGKVDDLNKRLM